MKKIKITFVLLAIVLIFATILSACDGNNNIVMSDPADTSGVDKTTDSVADNLDFGDLSSDTSPSDATQVPEGDYVFTESGNYLLSGNYGKLTIGADKLKLHIVLQGANFTSLTYGTSAEGDDFKKTELTLTLAENISNSANRADGNAVHVKGSVDINGKGSLDIQCGGKNAVKVSKALRITDANLTLTAANHAVSAQSITAKDCTLNVVAAGKDGLNAECDDETTAFTVDEGFVALRNVHYACNVEGDGIQADTVVYIDGGSYNITTKGNFVQNTAENREKYGLTADDFRYIKSGDVYQKVASDYRGANYALAQGCKGIKAGEIEYPDPDNKDNEITVTEGDYCIVIEGGDITVNATDDAIHVNSGSLLINGGSLDLTTLDDGLTADILAKITDGDVTVSNSYEGLEGAYVEIGGGTVNITATDDGINAASDDASIREHILISGGNVTVNAQGDGVDSNGSVEITGGTTVVQGPTGNGDGGLDSETGIYVNGGTLFVAASRGMTELPVSDSQQYVIAFGQTSNIAAGTVISVRDGGDILFEVATVKVSQTVIFSSPNLAKNGVYSVYAGETKLADIKVTSQVTSSGIQGGFGGDPGGWRPGGPGGFGGGSRP